MSKPHSESTVEEIQGIYGPFSFSELLFQKIWAGGAFDQSQLETVDGVRVRLRSAGRWNRLAGPDFQHARFSLGEGPEIVGDVELHLRAEDWAAHGHASDPAYAGVKLHVVLFPPRAGVVTRDGAGKAIPILVLLPWLHHDLEEYAAEEAVEALANRPETRVLDALQQMSSAELHAHLEEHARKRWEQKVHFAGLRIAKVGWAEACHQTAMDILGFRYNRVPMMRLAMRYELKRWAADELDVEALRAEEGERWTMSGVRPANHPRRRLQQYRDWVQARPDWPQRLVDLAGGLPEVGMGESTSAVRREAGFRGLRERIGEGICGHALGGTRLDTMICDGFWPLLAARSGRDLSGAWFHWYVGDAPEAWVKILRKAGRFEAGRAPACHGAVQGLLGKLLAHEK